MYRHAAWLALTVSVTGCGDAPDADVAGADTVLTNGLVYTVDRDRTRAQAVAISDGRIVYVGDDAGATAYIGDATTLVNLGGRMLLPAFQDSHIYLLMGGMQAAACNLAEYADVAGYRGAIAEYAAANPDFTLTLANQLMIVFLALMVSIGAAGIPHAGLVMMVIIFEAIGLPTALTALLWAVDRPLDMCRTVVNVWSDTMGTTAIAHAEKEIDDSVLFRPAA